MPVTMARTKDTEAAAELGTRLRRAYERRFRSVSDFRTAITMSMGGIGVPSDETLRKWLNGEGDPHTIDVPQAVHAAKVLDLDADELHPVLGQRVQLVRATSSYPQFAPGVLVHAA